MYKNCTHRRCENAIAAESIHDPYLKKHLENYMNRMGETDLSLWNIILKIAIDNGMDGCPGPFSKAGRN